MIIRYSFAGQELKRLDLFGGIKYSVDLQGTTGKSKGADSESSA
jgi:hypothetical protein